MQWSSTCTGLPADEKMWDMMKAARDAILAANSQKADVAEDQQWDAAIGATKALMPTLGEEGKWRMQFSGSTDDTKFISIFVELA